MASVSGRMLGDGKGKVIFRYGGNQYSKTLELRSGRDLERAVETVRIAIEDIERGRMVVPDDCDVRDFLVSGGKIRKQKETRSAQIARRETLGEVFDTYAANLTAGTKQASSLLTEKVHRTHFLTLLGGPTPVESLSLAKIQGYVDKRAAAGIARDTIEKELATLLVVLKWAHKRGHVPTGPQWARKDLTLPKGQEKPPFQTWDQIERRIKVERLEGERADKAWECLWLNQSQVSACLTWVAEHARRPYMPPMFAFAAYTGARRSEIIRSERVDWDFDGRTVLIRQKKSDTSRDFTTRPVAIHPRLAEIMQAWWEYQPESRWAISTEGRDPMNPQMATKYFKQSLAGGPWCVLHGWHAFRHSLASNMASAGVDQRVVDQVLGHSTDDMARRYRHLLPERREHAINSLYLGAPDMP